MAGSSEQQPGGRLSREEAGWLAGHLAGLTASGLPLGPGLRAAAQEMPRGRIRGTLLQLAEAVESGASLDEVVDSARDRLPGHLRGLVQVGARTGRLGEVLSRFVSYLETGVELQRRLWVSLAYPIILLLLVAALFAFASGLIVTRFEEIFKDFGVPLPVMTLALIRLSHVFGATWHGGVELAGGVLALLCLALLLNWLGVFSGKTARGLLGSIPVVGLVARSSALAEFCHLLGLLLESRVPLGEAVRLTGEGVEHRSITRACRQMGAEIDAGSTLSKAVAARPLFPRGMTRVLQWAEANQGLPDSLHMVGQMFEARARAQASFAGTVLSVVAVVIVILGVSWLVVGLFLPLITLVSKLSG